ncbi:PQQ-binding-like beta-propeller repeat protein [Planctomyces sp. SH-PL14]|uniref:PQQ-binding-like beta-propeller repeat protein n=1 Tax=Planctomyces sp. SH-PL14 TaxID=1632864 RepID=UPI0018D3F135|nr:PQQ-binding-like beta-propeller repeat protein [Planctomyces sp. SH-PL14]
MSGSLPRRTLLWATLRPAVPLLLWPLWGTGCQSQANSPAAGPPSASSSMVLTDDGAGTAAPDVATTAADRSEQASVSPPSKSRPGDWAQLFGANCDSRSPDHSLDWSWEPQGPPVVWRKPIGIGYSAPVLREGRLILQDRVEADERLVCFDAETGKERWITRFPSDYQCKYAYSSGSYATPTLTPEAIYAVTADGDVAAVTFDSGAPIWERPLLKETNAKIGAFGVGISPRLWQDRLILNIGGKDGQGIVALSAATGETLWSAIDYGRGYATAIVARQHGRDFAYVLTEQGLVSLDPNDGKVHWMYPFGIQASAERVNAVSPIVVGNLVIISSGPGPGTAVLDIQPDGSHKLVWKNQRVVDGQYTNLLELDGCLYGVTARRLAMLRCADLKTGKLLWEHESDLCRANTLFVDGHVLVLGEHGHLGAFVPGREKPALFQMTAEPVLSTPCYSTMALWAGRLFVRNEKEVVCLDLRTSSHPTVDGETLTRNERDAESRAGSVRAAAQARN